MRVILKRLDEEQTQPPFTRWNEDCQCVQITFDEGVTWVNTTDFDPRYGNGYRSPARTGGDPKCDAAANMLEFVRDYVNMIIADVGVVEAANAVLAIILLFVPGFGILVSLAIAVCEALIAIGGVAMNAAFSEEAYEQLLCCFYENIGDDGQMSESQYNDTLEQINTDIGGIVYTVCTLIFDLVGWVGFSNIGTGEETGDCDDCDHGNWCWEQCVDYIGSTFVFDIPEARVIGTIEMCIENVAVATGGYYFEGDFHSLGDMYNPHETCDECGASGDTSYIRKLTGLGLLMDAVGWIEANPTTHVKWIRLRGEGTNPFGEDNCE